MSNYKQTTSLHKILTKIIDSKIDENKPKTTTGIILYRSGSDLTPVNLGKLSY